MDRLGKMFDWIWYRAKSEAETGCLEPRVRCVVEGRELREVIYGVWGHYF